MLIRVWQTSKPMQGMRVRVEEHKCSDGNHYSLITNFKTMNIADKEEAERVIKAWRMVEVTQEYKDAGWINTSI